MPDLTKTTAGPVGLADTFLERLEAVDHAEQSHELQERLSTAERTDEYFLGIDPGFVHQRKIETIIGTTGMEIVDSLIGELPDLPDWQRTVRIDHIYTKVMLGLCEALEVPPLGQLLNERKGRLFTSTELLAPAPEVYSAARAISVIATQGFDLRTELHYSAERIASTTLKTELHNGGEVGIVAELHSQRGESRHLPPTCHRWSVALPRGALAPKQRGHVVGLRDGRGLRRRHRRATGSFDGLLHRGLGGHGSDHGGGLQGMPRGNPGRLRAH